MTSRVGAAGGWMDGRCWGGILTLGLVGGGDGGCAVGGVGVWDGKKVGFGMSSWVIIRRTGHGDFEVVGTGLMFETG